MSCLSLATVQQQHLCWHSSVAVMSKGSKQSAATTQRAEPANSECSLGCPVNWLWSCHHHHHCFCSNFGLGPTQVHGYKFSLTEIMPHSPDRPR